MNHKNLYLYCVTEGSENEISAELKGLNGEDVFSFLNHSLTAIVQECNAAFSSEDPKVITAWALTHQTIVNTVWEKFGSVLPFSFNTLVFPKDEHTARENLSSWMHKETDTLKEQLTKLKGKAEYGVQISWDPNLIAPRIMQNDPQIKQLEDAILGKEAGTQYLLQHKKKDLLKQGLESAADVYFREFYESILQLVEKVHVETVKKEEPPRQMLMNLSCLLPKGHTEKLSGVLEKIAKIKGFFVRFTGPWPPYSFAKSS